MFDFFCDFLNDYSSLLGAFLACFLLLVSFWRFVSSLREDD